MRWLRELERKIEAKLEGGQGGELHALEATRLASGVLYDNCHRPHSALKVAPNHIFVPLDHPEKVAPNFESEVARLLADEADQRGYRLLAPIVVQVVGPEVGLSGIVADWTDSEGRAAFGYGEGLAGVAQGNLWAIGEKGAVLGRGSDVDIRLLDPEISRHHVEVRVVGDGRIQLEDLGSHNGTKVGRKSLLAPTVYKTGVKISLGASVVRLWTLPWVEVKNS